MENRLDTGFIQTLLGLVLNAAGRRSCSKYIIEKQVLFSKELIRIQCPGGGKKRSSKPLGGHSDLYIEKTPICKEKQGVE